MRKLLLLCLTAGMFFTACNNDEDTPPLAVAAVNVTHASPGTGGVDIYFHPNKINSAPFMYLNNTGYADAYPGERQFRVTLPGSAANILERKVALEPNTRYSIFIADTASRLTSIIVKDEFPAMASGKAHVRFFHLAPGAPAVTIGTLAGGTFTPLFTNRAFETEATAQANQAFTAMAAGTYTIEVRIAESDTPVLTIPGAALAEGKIYTIYAKGLAGSVSTPLGAEVITNK